MDRNSAWTQLYRESNCEREVWKMLRRYAIAHNIRKQDAEDAYSIALEESLKVTERFQEHPKEFVLWVFGVARNKLRDSFRKQPSGSGYWKWNGEIYRRRPDREATWVQFEPVQIWTESDSSFLLKEVIGDRVGETPNLHPRRHSFLISVKEDVGRPEGRGGLVYDYLRAYGKPVKTCRARPYVAALFEMHQFSPDFRWTDFENILECQY